MVDKTGNTHGGEKKQIAGSSLLNVRQDHKVWFQNFPWAEDANAFPEALEQLGRVRERKMNEQAEQALNPI